MYCSKPLIKDHIVVSVVSGDRRYGTHTCILNLQLHYGILIFLTLEPLFCKEGLATSINNRDIDSIASTRARSDELATNTEEANPTLGAPVASAPDSVDAK